MYSQIAANKRKTVYIMLFFVALIAGLAYLFSAYFGGNHNVFYGGLIGSVVYAFITYFAGGRMSLAVNGAQEIQKTDNPRLWRIVENLSITDGLPMPRVYIMPDPTLNAFATGRDPKHSAVCVTAGLLDAMTDTELEGVLAHELGHVKNYDIRVSMMAFALTAVISLLADVLLRASFFRGGDDEEAGGNSLFFVLGIVAAIVAPIVATLIQLAVSRQREYLADATGALTTRYPEGLASALEKIGQVGSATRRQNTSTAHLFFASPLRGHSFSNLFSTHPPIADRVARLRSMGTKA
ncbi:MAG: M48 family metalloprotease [Patescibacteria group bacterium]|nr:M48 family metalloprotease [Patescibacteria group bacterium]